MPSMPYRHMKDNPFRYRDPKERDMKSKEIEITTVDNIKLRG
jgi:hypothetical protein